MPKQLAVVMIHGIGRQRPDYAARMIRNIEQQLVVQGYEPDTIAWQPVYWDDILAPAEKAYLERSLGTASLRTHRLRRWDCSGPREVDYHLNPAVTQFQ